MINKERVLERFLEYVQIDSPTREERKMANHLIKELEDLGFEVTMDDAGKKVGSDSGNVIAKLKGNVEGETILFSSHMDTVSPARGIKPVIKDGVIYSDGTTVLGGDDKSGVAGIMEAVETVIENDLPHTDIEIVFSIFEEGGLYGVKNLDLEKVNADRVFVFDSGGSPGQIIVQGPAQNKIKVDFIGKEAHAGVAPEEGISAIEIAAEAITNMKLLRIDEETTANIGSIEGGEVTNIVPNKVSIYAEARSLVDEKLEKQVESMVKACKDAADKYGGSVDIRVEDTYGAFNIDEDHDVVEKVKEACNNLDLDISIQASGGGSDTNIWNGHNIPAVNLGTGMTNVHTVEENIKIKDLEDTARLALEIIKVYSK